MSATNRWAVRSPGDFYETPAWAVRAILPYLPLNGVRVDAGCGTGAIMMCLPEKTIGVEVSPVHAAAARAKGHHVVEQDFLTYEQNAGLVISNPPFVLAEQFIQHAHTLVAQWGGVTAMLLRLNFLASQKRAGLFSVWNPDVYVLHRRPSFTADKKTDATEYAWFVSGRGRGGHWLRLNELEAGR